MTKERLQLSLLAQGLEGHLDGTMTKPVTPMETTAADGTVTPLKPEEIEAYQKSLREWTQNRAIAMQHIASTVLDTLYLRIRDKGTMKEAWDALKNEFEHRS